MANPTVQDVINRVNDHGANYSTGQAGNDTKIRGIDSAINYLKNMIGMPSDEKLYSFYFSADNLYYNAPSDYQEITGPLFYDDTTKNTLGNSWDYRPYQEVLPRLGSFPNQNTFSDTTINGSKQFLLWGNTIVPSLLIDSFDLNVWTASGDASSNVLDTTVFYQGTASNAFTLTYASGTGTLTYPATLALDVSTLFQKFGNFNLYAYFASTAVTSVALRVKQDNSNYWTITATTQASGAAWTLNSWNKVVFATTAAVKTGSPSASSITSLQLVFTIPNTFGTVANMRVDDLYLTYPDYVHLPYLSTVKGTNAAGSTISTLSALTDTLSCDWDFIEPISLRAALYVWPSLRGDLNFKQLYKQDFMETVKLWGRRYPKNRYTNKFLRTQLKR